MLASLGCSQHLGLPETEEQLCVEELIAKQASGGADLGIGRLEAGPSTVETGTQRGALENLGLWKAQLSGSSALKSSSLTAFSKVYPTGSRVKIGGIVDPATTPPSRIVE